jgi:hypothetical protein
MVDGVSLMGIKLMRRSGVVWEGWLDLLAAARQTIKALRYQLYWLELTKNWQLRAPTTTFEKLGVYSFFQATDKAATSLVINIYGTAMTGGNFPWLCGRH